MASRSTGELVAHLKAAGELLRSVADAGDRMQVSRRILDVAHRLDQAGSRPAAGEPAAASDAGVVPIESLEFDAIAHPQGDVVPIAGLGPDPEPLPSEGGALERSFRTLERLQGERGSAPATLDAFLGRVEPAGDAVGDAVAVESLCYRGRAALERAAAVRQTLTAELAGGPDLAAIRPLLQELLDLVPLALDES
jgi:hypothetical protein